LEQLYKIQLSEDLIFLRKGDKLAVQSCLPLFLSWLLASLAVFRRVLSLPYCSFITCLVHLFGTEATHTWQLD